MDRNQRPGTCSPGPVSWFLGPRTRKREPRNQDLGPETQDPQSRTNDLELTIEDLGPKTKASDMIYLIMV